MHKVEKAFSLDPPLVQIAAAQLREAIMWARFAPGMKLKVADLQARFGLSSSPLREALGRLVAEGLVVVEDRRGFRVAGVTPAEVEDVARMRILLEQEAMRASIEHGGDAWESDIVSAFTRCVSWKSAWPTSRRPSIRTGASVIAPSTWRFCRHADRPI